MYDQVNYIVEMDYKTVMVDENKLKCKGKNQPKS